jgi:hypothetical protein
MNPHLENFRGLLIRRNFMQIVTQLDQIIFFLS